MRRRLGASALALAVLVGAVPLAAGAAGAVTGAVAPADDVFYPEDDRPADKAVQPPVGDAGNADRAENAATVTSTSARDREAALMRGSRQAADTAGWMPSLYQGKWYMPAKEDIRRCIMDRESNFNYRVVGAGLYFGAYQMNRGLAVGATHMMEKEVAKEFGEEGVAILRALRKTPPHTWNRYWQDRAFWTIWRNGEGAGHWRGGSHSCF
jgi:hypothetical protein